LGADWLTGQEAPTTYTDIFNRVCPQYLAMGMTYEQFWYDDPSIVKFYREAEELKRRHQEFNRWKMAAYILCALQDTHPNRQKGFPNQFPKEPFAATPLEAEERQKAKAKHTIADYMNSSMAVINKKRREAN